jgi:hypothetical protein
MAFLSAPLINETTMNRVQESTIGFPAIQTERIQMNVKKGAYSLAQPR